MAEGDGDRVAAAHEDALDEGLAAVGVAGPSAKSTGSGDVPEIGRRSGWQAAAQRTLRRGRARLPDLALQALLEALDLAGRVDDRLLAREERVAVAAHVDAQLRRVEPTVNSVPHEPQWTLAW